MSFKIRTKLILAFLVMLIPLFIFMIINYSIQGAVHESFNKVKEISEEIQTLGGLQVAIGKVLMPGNDYIITGDRRYIKEFERASADLENQLRSADEILTRLKAHKGLNPAELEEEEEILKSVNTAWENIKGISLRLFAIHDPIGSRTAAGLMEEMDYKWAYPAVEQLGRWREIDREEYREVEEAADRAWRHHLIIMAASIATLIVFGIFLSLFLSRLFAIPLRELQEGVEALAGGNLDYRLSIPATGDEIGQLARGFNVMAERLNESTGALRESEANLNKAQAVAHIGSWFLDVTKNKLFWSDETYRMFGVLKGTPLTYEKFLDIVHPDDREYVDRKWTAALNKEPYDIEHRIIVDGKLKWVRERAEVEFNEEGEAVKGIGTVQDITERKRVEEALRENEERYRILYDNIPTMNFTLDTSGNVVSLNQFAIRELGYQPEELVGKPVLDIFYDEDKPALLKQFGEVLQNPGRAYGWELRKVHKEGHIVWVREIACTTKDQTGGIIILVACQDISERKKAEEVLQESEKRYKHLVESVTNYIYTVKIENGRAAATSHGPGCVMTGYASEEYEADPSLWYRMVYEEDKKAVMEQAKRVLSDEAVSPLEHRIIHRDGLVRWVRNTPVPHHDEQGRLIAYDGLIQDITEIKRIGEQLRHAQKMESIGQLAGGIAHDFNNLLTSILGYSDLALIDLPEDHPLRETLGIIKSSAEKAAELTRQILAFSRKQVLDMKVVNLNTVVEQMGKMLQRVITENIVLDLKTSPIMNVMADAGQVEQILMNLVINARDAMPDGGCLTIETADVRLDRNYAQRHESVQPGPYVMLAVTDTGVGMSQEVQEKIFDPFFTTKEKGRGTGLGLSMVYGIVKQHTGYIWVYSEAGKGTTFKIYLPAVQQAVEVKEQGRDEPGEMPRGSETIMVVDDEPSILSLILDVLQPLGYQLIGASSGEEALKAGNTFKGSVGLLLTDVILPGMHGKELADALRARRPKMKVIFMSGYADNAIVHQGILDPGIAFLQKPMTPGMLARKVRDVLDQEA